jgi:phospholipase D1/2
METWYQILIKKIEDYHLSLKNVYDSFANERSLCNAKWFVDAHDYFSHLYDNILQAKESIFIAGWWVSPELYLKRPVKKSELHTMRLMDILKHKVYYSNLKAEQGVNIHILIYKEFKMAVSVNSQHTKEIFNDLHPNIKVNS